MQGGKGSLTDRGGHIWVPKRQLSVGGGFMQGPEHYREGKLREE